MFEELNFSLLWFLSLGFPAIFLKIRSGGGHIGRCRYSDTKKEQIYPPEIKYVYKKEKVSKIPPPALGQKASPQSQKKWFFSSNCAYKTDPFEIFSPSIIVCFWQLKNQERIFKSNCAYNTRHYSESYVHNYSVSFNKKITKFISRVKTLYNRW